MKLHRFLVAVLLALGWAVPSHAQVVLFDNLSELTEPGTLPFFFATTLAASDFRTGGTASTITELTIEMANTGSTAHTFTFGIYADASGKPGSLVKNFATSPSIPANGTGPLTATSPGINLLPNTTYWVVGQDNDGNAAATWALTLSEANSGTFATLPATEAQLRFSNVTPFFNLSPGNFQYSLSGPAVPEPQTWVALVATTGGFLALRGRGLIRRRQG